MTEMLDWKGPITNVVVGKLKDGLTELAVSYVEALPILIGVSIGVYALLSMFSRTFAKIGVFGVFAYGAVVVVIA